MRAKIKNADGVVVAYGEASLEQILLNIPEGGSYEELPEGEPIPVQQESVAPPYDG